MGQHRPVQVFNLVTRDSIEERVLRSLAQKRSLFEGVFEGNSNEVLIDQLGQQAFVDNIRALIAEEQQAPAPVVAVSVEAGIDPRQALVQAGVQFLEALAAVIKTWPAPDPGQGKVVAELSLFLGTDARTGQPVLQMPLPTAELLQRGAAAVKAIIGGLGTTPRNGDGA